MSYTAGNRLGRYEIRGLLGSGGMGEVYRAWDERLGREVAIKVLRGDAGGDAESRRRFANEARAASALNHRNILTVHDVSREGEAPYIVTELVDGESLSDIMQRGPVQVKRTLDIAAQVASGLAAAHETGIVHRDMKPGNIMVSRDGTVKILDFGVAKTMRAQAAAAMQTSAGMILGTPAYMSPEQAQGESLDGRSDQFSFGLVLYRMLTGRAPFERTSTVGLMAAIVEDEVPSIADLSPNVPAQLRWCVERCLAKDRAQRYASTSDLHHELRCIQEHLPELSTQGRAALAPAPVPGTKRHWRRLAWAAAGLAAGFALALLLAGSGEGVDLRDYQLAPLAAGTESAMGPAWSHDGKQIAYTAEVNGVWQVTLHSLDSTASAQITQAAVDCEAPFWSADGARVFYRAGGALWSVGAAGGIPQRIQPDVAAASLAPDGGTLAFLRVDGTGKEPLALWLAQPPQAAPRKYSAGPFATRNYREGFVRFSRDGKKLGVWLARWNGRSEFWVLPFPDGKPEQSFGLVQGSYPFEWMPDNRRIVFGGALPGTLGRDLQVADTRSRTIRPLTVTTQDAVLPAVSPDGGKIAFTLANNDFNLIEIPLDGSAVWDLLNTSRDEVDPTFSPVADEYAYTTNRTGREQIWLRSRRGDWERPVVTEKDFSEAWILSLRETSFAPDGQRIAYAAVGSRGHAVYISNAKGGTPLRLTAGKEPYERSPSWNPAGNWIAYLQNNDGRWALAKAPTGGGEQPVILREGCLRSHPKWSKRGDWITCQTPDGLTLVSPDGKTSKVISKEDWVVYGWSADGGTLYGIKRAANGASVLASIAVDSGAGKTIADLKLPAHAELAGYSLDRGALSFATSVNRPRADIWTLEGFGPPAGWRRWLAFR